MSLGEQLNDLLGELFPTDDVGQKYKYQGDVISFFGLSMLCDDYQVRLLRFISPETITETHNISLHGHGIQAIGPIKHGPLEILTEADLNLIDAIRNHHDLLNGVTRHLPCEYKFNVKIKIGLSPIINQSWKFVGCFISDFQLVTSYDGLEFCELKIIFDYFEQEGV